ncbi:HNH endonuclease signature motif containing protein [Agromyces laixinhei]|uniref:HNH endonuclease signature motif containing protein n=1 Tax=Agromyces laixinhei TaxID=2585717 RepID=UPI0018DCC784|nr:HNH endonuclease signature motif containing protein [Agromyces laixinhei]
MEDAFDSMTATPLAVEAMHEFAGVDARFDAFAALESALDEAETARFSANRAMAVHLDAVRLAIEMSRRDPSLYLRPAAVAAPGAEDLAVRAAAAELSMRLRIPAGTIRNRAHEASVLQRCLPLVWERFSDGVADYSDVRVAVDATSGFAAGDPRLVELDAGLAEVIGTITTVQLRQRARTLRARLERDGLEARHTRAYASRRVVIEHIDDGMAWVSLLTSSVDAARIRARLDATAQRLSGSADEPRNRDQLRADTAVAWLVGDGTPTAARVEVVVTVPVLGLAGVSDQPAMLDGVGPIDRATARQLFADAPSFLRLAVDPITSAPLDLDRTRYRPSNAQRTWLAVTHGRCTRPGCNRLAVSSDIDHVRDWQHGGATDRANLAPLCRGDHRLKHVAKFATVKHSDQSVAWRSPVGRSYTGPPPF